VDLRADAEELRLHVVVVGAGIAGLEVEAALLAGAIE
jgi:NADH dehydrogenase FAD-containing subunit